MAALGRVIRDRRKDMGITQEQLAPMLGMSARLVGEIERGRGSVGFEKVLHACKALGLDLYVKSR